VSIFPAAPLEECAREVLAVRRRGHGPGSGWVSYLFKDPITGKLLPKTSYVEKSGEYAYVAGVYAR
jgi:hypothetical protein